MEHVSVWGGVPRALAMAKIGSLLNGFFLFEIVALSSIETESDASKSSEQFSSLLTSVISLAFNPTSRGRT